MLRVRGLMLKVFWLVFAVLLACLYVAPLGPEAEGRKLQTAFTLLAIFTAVIGVLQHDVRASVRRTPLYELKHADTS